MNIGLVASCWFVSPHPMCQEFIEYKKKKRERERERERGGVNSKIFSGLLPVKCLIF